MTAGLALLAYIVCGAFHVEKDPEGNLRWKKYVPSSIIETEAPWVNHPSRFQITDL